MTNVLRSLRGNVLGWLLAGALLAGGRTVAQEAIPPEKLRVMVEALARINRDQIEANPQLKVALDRVLQATRGGADYVRLVKGLGLPDHVDGLLEVVRTDVPPDVAVEAMRLLLDRADGASLGPTLFVGAPGSGLRCVETLGNCLDRRAVPLLLSVIQEPGRDVTIRRAAVRSLVRTQAGAAALLALAKKDALPGDLRFVASTELGNVRWPELKAEAAQVFPPLNGPDAAPLPPVAELLRRAGDPRKGAAVFRRDTVGCIKCHRVRGEGTDFGPDLSEIGTKLGKDALLEAVLDPSSGISFGFEAWTITLKDGDEVYGLLVSETEDEIAIKAQGGVVTKHKKSDIATREKMKTSIMPAGLQAAMTAQELVDLLDYLSSLRAPEAH